MADVSLYLHLPFCAQRCTYCDFNIYTSLGHLQAEYGLALRREIAAVSAAAPQRLSVPSVYVGGGTPSLTPLPILAEIFAALGQHFDLTADCEITFEANPGTVDLATLQALRAMGVNRLSLGMQSAHNHELRQVQRGHTFADTQQAASWARQAGFENLSLDLIYGWPGQSLAHWQQTLSAAQALNPDHLSIYALSLAFNTPMAAQVQRGQLPIPDDDLAADMYLWAQTELQATFRQYELANWASQQPPRDLRSRHNLRYWHYQEWLGLGAGAHGHVAGLRYSGVRGPSAYIRRMASPTQRTYPLTAATVQATRIDPQTAMAEYLFMGLRLVDEGVSAAAFAERFGEGLLDIFGPAIAPLIGQGLLTWANEKPQRLLLTARGQLLSNRVFAAFV